MSEEDKKIDNYRLSLRITPLGKDSAKLGVRSPEYVPQPEEKSPKYFPQPKEKFHEYVPQPDDEMVDDNIESGSEDDLLINCNIVLVLPAEYDCISEVSKTKEDYVQYDSTNQKLLFYYVMNNGIVEIQQAIFEKLDIGMMYHLKPFLIREKVDNIVVYKFFVDKGATINLVPNFLFKKIGKSNTYL